MNGFAPVCGERGTRSQISSSLSSVRVHLVCMDCACVCLCVSCTNDVLSKGATLRSEHLLAFRESPGRIDSESSWRLRSGSVARATWRCAGGTQAAES